MLPIVFALFAAATPSGPMPTLTTVGPHCGSEQPIDGDLELTYTVREQSCAPGGLCSQISSTPRSARFMRVHLRGCEGYVPGRFETAGRRCDGAPVWRFTGRIPSGAQISIRGEGASFGWLSTTGPATGRCPPLRTPGIRRSDPETGPVFTTEVPLGADAFELLQDGDGTRLRWHAERDGVGSLAPGHAVLEGELAATPADLEGQTGRLRTRVDRWVERRTWPGYRECFYLERIRSWLTVEGVEGSVEVVRERRRAARGCDVD